MLSPSNKRRTRLLLLVWFTLHIHFTCSYIFPWGAHFSTVTHNNCFTTTTVRGALPKTEEYRDFQSSQRRTRNAHAKRHLLDSSSRTHTSELRWNESASETNKYSTSTNRLDFLSFSFGCFVLALLLSLHDDVYCTFLKPKLTASHHEFSSFRPGFVAENKLLQSSSTNDPMVWWWGSGTRGLGWGQLERRGGPGSTSQQDMDTDLQMPSLESYNEVMERHFKIQVPRWKKNSNNFKEGKELASESVLAWATERIVDALRLTLHLKDLASDYQWEEMSMLLRSPTMTYQLEEACSILKNARAWIDDDGRNDIGFDWGSCAWRHCGAQADAQEAISELYNSVGLFEPFEALFVLDVIERSLRDILTVIPDQFFLQNTITTSTPKPSTNNGSVRPYPTYLPYKVFDQTQTIDSDFLHAMSELSLEQIN